MSEQPPGFPPPDDSKEWQQKKGLSHWRLPILVFIVISIAVLGLIAFLGRTIGHYNKAGAPPPAPSFSASKVGIAPVGPVASPTPSLQTPTTVKFVISGYAPPLGDLVPYVDYGSDRKQYGIHPDGIRGTLNYAVPFDPKARNYWVNVHIEHHGYLTCKIVVTGPYPDSPTTVSSGNSSNGEGNCQAYAIRLDPNGLVWQQTEP